MQSSVPDSIDLIRFSECPFVAQRYQSLEEKLKGLDTLVADGVGAEQVAAIVSRWTGIPVTRLSRTESERMMGLGDRLGARVVGQPKAVRAVADAVLRARAGLGAGAPHDHCWHLGCPAIIVRTGARPVGSFLFMGPTGVGKTELAKALAVELFDDEKQIVRLDMSEFLEQVRNLSTET